SSLVQVFATRRQDLFCGGPCRGSCPAEPVVQEAAPAGVRGTARAGFGLWGSRRASGRPGGTRPPRRHAASPAERAAVVKPAAHCVTRDAGRGKQRHESMNSAGAACPRARRGRRGLAAGTKSATSTVFPARTIFSTNGPPAAARRPGRTLYRNDTRGA